MDTLTLPDSGTFAGQTVLQACWDVYIRSCYGQGSAAAVGALLFDALLKLETDRVVFQEFNGFMDSGRAIHFLTKLREDEKKGSLGQVSRGMQFCVLLPEFKAKFSEYISEVKTFKLDKEEPASILSWMYHLYSLNANKAEGKKYDWEVELVKSSVDDIYSVVCDFDASAVKAGNLFKWMATLPPCETVKLIEWHDLQAEENLPKPPDLVWSEELKGNENCNYDHCIASTVFGDIRIEWKSWKEHDSFDFELPIPNAIGGQNFFSANTLEGAKKKAQTWYTYYMRLAMGHNVRKPRD